MWKIKKLYERNGPRMCKSHDMTDSLQQEGQPLLIEEQTDMSAHNTAVMTYYMPKTKATKGWQRRFCSFWKSIITLRFLAKLFTGGRRGSQDATALTNAPESQGGEDTPDGDYHPPIHQDEQDYTSRRHVYVYNSCPPKILEKYLSPLILHDVQFGDKSKFCTPEMTPVPYLKEGSSPLNISLHKAYNHLGRCLNIVLSYAAKTKIFPGSFSMDQSSDPIDSCRITLIYINNNLPACSELFGFDSPDSLKQTIESILGDIPRVWNCEDRETVIDIMTTQKIMVSQAAEALSRHDEPMDELAEHLRKTVEAMECDIREARKFVVLTNN